MEKFMKWVNEKLAPPLYKITQFRWVASISAGFFKVMSLIIVGAIFSIIANLSSVALPQFAGSLNLIYNLTFGLLSLFLTYHIAYSLAQEHGENGLSAGIFAISVWFILHKPVIDEQSMLQMDFSRFGANGLFVAILAGLFTGELMGQMQKRNWTFSAKALPDFVKDWFTPLVPGFLVVLLAWVFAYILNIDLYAAIANIISPLLSTSDTFAGFVGTMFFLTALFAVGINGAVTFGILFPLWFAAMGENTALVAQGLEPIHINTIQVLSAFCVLGGTGSTLALNFLMMRSKSETLKSLGKAAIVPSLMNINEPLIFGLPIAFNPILAIPFILNGGIINPILTYLAMDSGLVSKPVNPLIMPWVPVGITGFLYTTDFKAIILTVVLLAINLVVWYPFFKSHEKTLIAKESKTK